MKTITHPCSNNSKPHKRQKNKQFTQTTTHYRKKEPTTRAERNADVATETDAENRSANR